MGATPRPEHPQPQMERAEWMNLNGEWDFEFDFGNSGIHRKLYENTELGGKITVPFCPESSLSGVGHKDFIRAVWYHRTVILTGRQLHGRVLLHFGAVDYECRVWINGREAGTHKGGYSSFCFDITELVLEGENHLCVYAGDDTVSGRQPRGKQSSRYESWGCDYTRTTGIWQTVWMEFVPECYIEKLQYYPNISEGTLTVKAVTHGSGTLTAKALYESKVCGNARTEVSACGAVLTLTLSELHLWEPGAGRLYDLELSFGEDRVHSYFGMREIKVQGEKFLINGKSVFQRLVLDQGFYPDGIYTAPTEEALRQDILLSLDAGFNGARLHQKVFEPRFLYHCDKLGYLVWGEQASWGLDISSQAGLKYFLPEWMEVLERDFNHPSIIGWCPFNETWDYDGRMQDNDLLAVVYRMTKLYDTTRPCIDTSGNYHVITDIYDLHDYEQNPEIFAASYADFAQGGALKDTHPHRQMPVKGVPVFISEYGGIKWDVENKIEKSWGYGQGPETEDAFIQRYQGLTDSLLDNPHMFGFCYTQLYDVEQEVNGLYTYGRKPKFDMAVFKKINSRRAAIED
ncbi:MAG: beta-galactosidase [Lachnospiraceae bacterium]|nr:beta-galactosidase [Lachnospiraceae bacterium]